MSLGKGIELGCSEVLCFEGEEETLLKLKGGTGVGSDISGREVTVVIGDGVADWFSESDPSCLRRFAGCASFKGDDARLPCSLEEIEDTSATADFGSASNTSTC